MPQLHGAWKGMLNILKRQDHQRLDAVHATDWAPRISGKAKSKAGSLFLHLFCQMMNHDQGKQLTESNRPKPATVLYHAFKDTAMANSMMNDYQ